MLSPTAAVKRLIKPNITGKLDFKGKFVVQFNDSLSVRSCNLLGFQTSFINYTSADFKSDVTQCVDIGKFYEKTKFYEFLEVI